MALDRAIRHGWSTGTGKTTTSAIIARISFIAYVTSDALDLVKLYLEQGISVRFRKKGHGIICTYCNRHGIFKTMV